MPTPAGTPPESWRGPTHGSHIEPYGIDISPALAQVARRRQPVWSDRIWTANAATWDPPRTFDFVRTGLEYVPADRQRALVRRLLDRAVRDGGRLIVGKSNEERSATSIGERLSSWGFEVSGSLHRPHQHPDVVHTVYWIDKSSAA